MTTIRAGISVSIFCFYLIPAVTMAQAKPIPVLRCYDFNERGENPGEPIWATFCYLDMCPCPPPDGGVEYSTTSSTPNLGCSVVGGCTILGKYDGCKDFLKSIPEAPTGTCDGPYACTQDAGCSANETCRTTTKSGNTDWQLMSAPLSLSPCRRSRRRKHTARVSRTRTKSALSQGQSLSFGRLKLGRRPGQSFDGRDAVRLD